MQELTRSSWVPAAGEAVVINGDSTMHVWTIAVVYDTGHIKIRDGMGHEKQLKIEDVTPIEQKWVQKFYDRDYPVVEVDFTTDILEKTTPGEVVNSLYMLRPWCIKEMFMVNCEPVHTGDMQTVSKPMLIIRPLNKTSLYWIDRVLQDFGFDVRLR